MAFCTCQSSLYQSIVKLGAHLAEVNLFLAMANILATFDIRKKVNVHGKEVDPAIEWMGGEPAA